MLAWKSYGKIKMSFHITTRDTEILFTLFLFCRFLFINSILCLNIYIFQALYIIYIALYFNGIGDPPYRPCHGSWHWILAINSEGTLFLHKEAGAKFFSFLLNVLLFFIFHSYLNCGTFTKLLTAVLFEKLIKIYDVIS